MRILSVLLGSLFVLGFATAQTPPASASPLVQDPQAPFAAETPVQQTALGETTVSPRIRSVTRLHNSMPHQLIGIGLVTGLSNTGSSDRGTRQAIINFVRQHGLNLGIADVVGGTTALVSLTCTLPPFASITSTRRSAMT